MTKEKVEEMIKRELRVGSSTEDIEAFYKKNNISYSYDNFAKRYQSTIRNIPTMPWLDKSIGIYIYVDDEKKFLKAEVDYSYTFL